MNWTYLDAPIVCEECGKVLEEHSGYTSTQHGICDDCLARVTQSNTGLQADVCPACRGNKEILVEGEWRKCFACHGTGNAAKA